LRPMVTQNHREVLT